MSKEQKFFPGEKVVFTGPYMFKNEVQSGNDLFDADAEHEVMDHSYWQGQWDAFEKPHVILRTRKGSSNWVDEDCLALVVTAEELEATLRSIASATRVPR